MRFLWLFIFLAPLAYNALSQNKTASVKGKLIDEQGKGLLGIISGILIWRTTRNNNKYTSKQRLFHHNITKISLAICLSLFPAFTILFLANKLVPMDFINRVDLVNQLFFAGWLALTIIGSLWKSYAKQNRNYLLIGGVLSLCLPLANGFTTRDWFWQVWSTLPRVSYVDVFWLISGLSSLYLSIFVLNTSNKSDKPTQEYSIPDRNQNAKFILKVKPKAIKPRLVSS